MRKLFILALILIASVSFGQQVKKHLITVVATGNTAFWEPVKAGEFVFNQADSTLYCASIDLSRYATVNYMKLVHTRYQTVMSGAVKAVTLAATDTLMGIRLQAADSSWWRITVSPTGVIGTYTATTP